MLIYYCISLMMLLTMLMTGIINPICSFLSGDTEIKFNYFNIMSMYSMF